MGQHALQPGVCLSTGECAHLISEGTETIGPSRAGCPSTGRVPRHQGVLAPHLGGSCDYKNHPGLGAQQPGVCPSTRECSHLLLEGPETTNTDRGWGTSNQACAYPPGKACTKSLEGAETTGTTRGRVPSNWECA